MLDKLLAELSALSLLTLTFACGAIYQRLRGVERDFGKHLVEHKELQAKCDEIIRDQTDIANLKASIDEIKDELREIRAQLRTGLAATHCRLAPGGGSSGLGEEGV